MKKALLFVLFTVTIASAQEQRYDNFAATLTSASGIGNLTQVIPNATITVFNQPAVGVSCAGGGCVAATTFTSRTGGTPCGGGLPLTRPTTNVCVATADASANFGFWAAAGAYQYCVAATSITTQCFNVILGPPLDGVNTFSATNTFSVNTIFSASLQFAETTAPAGSAGNDICYGDSTAHAAKCSYNNGTFFPQTQTVATGTAVMTTAAITAGNCGTTVTVSATGVATTDTIVWSFNAGPASNASNAGIVSWVTANNVNFAYCSNTAQTPTAATLNWRVIR